VISLDEMLHKLLTRKAILSVFLPPLSLLNPDAYFSAPFERVMMIRLAVMRIINHLGFDVANYDTDAIILKDPQPLYSNLSRYDVIGSVGRIPDNLAQEWGITICNGVVLLRASKRIGKNSIYSVQWCSLSSCSHCCSGRGRFDLIDSMVQPIRGEMTLAPRYEVIVVLDCYVTLLEVTLRLWIP